MNIGNTKNSSAPLTRQKPPRNNQYFKKRFSKYLAGLIRFIFLLAFSYILLYPLFFMISSSVKAGRDFVDPSIVWVAKHFSLDSFKNAAKALNYGKAIFNTIQLEVVSALLEVCTCAIAAYGLARFKFKEKNILIIILFLTILVPPQMIIIPNVLNFKHMDFLGILGLIGKLIGTELRVNLLNTPFTFYLPSLFGVGLRSGVLIYIYMQFFKGLPKELEEAAWVDGSGPIQTFAKIIVPSSGVVIMTVTIFSVIWHWNDYYLAVMYTSKNYPISVALSNIYSTLDTMGFSSYSGETTAIVMAACLMSIFPMLVMYLILQKKFIQSVDRVGIVG